MVTETCYLSATIGRVPGSPFTLNSAVDKLLKKEFDTYRVAGTAHPLFKKFGVKAIPFTNEELKEWRLTPNWGAAYLHGPTNLLIKGIIDDIWLLRLDGQLVIADYKATAKAGEVSIDAPWQSSYKRQMEIYQWIFRRNDFSVFDLAYFVYNTLPIIHNQFLHWQVRSKKSQMLNGRSFNIQARRNTSQRSNELKIHRVCRGCPRHFRK